MRHSTGSGSFGRDERGLALLTAILIMLFLSLAGGALLSATRVDVRIADNYGTGVRSLYLAEAGIEAARLALRTSPNTLAADLGSAAGGDGALETSLDLNALLASDDQPLLPASTAARTAGQTMADTTGRNAGSYHVWLRNDVGDGPDSTTETNDVVSLVSIARIGDAVRTVEAVVKRASLPPLPAALTLDGPVSPFLPANSNNFEINGYDQSGNGQNTYGIGVISGADDAYVSGQIPANRQDNYQGLGGEEPNVQDISGLLPAEYATVSGLESVVAGLEATATTVYNPAFGAATSIGNVGTATDQRIVVVNGDCDFGPGDGYGILVVRGDLIVQGNFSWTGMILVVGQGTLRWNGGGNGEVSGGIFLARTRDTRTASDLLGPLRSTRGSVAIDFNGGGGNGILFNSDSTANAQSGFPYVPISITEY
jgi:Tfp pilus assembly protein PilX